MCIDKYVDQWSNRENDEKIDKKDEKDNIYGILSNNTLFHTGCNL